jgi:hypothetical protein
VTDLDVNTALQTYAGLMRQVRLIDKQKLPLRERRRTEQSGWNHQQQVVAKFAELNGWYRVSPQNSGHRTLASSAATRGSIKATATELTDT